MDIFDWHISCEGASGLINISNTIIAQFRLRSYDSLFYMQYKHLEKNKVVNYNEVYQFVCHFLHVCMISLKILNSENKSIIHQNDYCVFKNIQG